LQKLIFCCIDKNDRVKRLLQWYDLENRIC